MSDQTATLPAQADATGGSPGRKRLVMVVGALLVAVAVGWYLGLIPPGGGEAAAEDAVEPAPVVEGAVVDVAELMTSIGGDQPGYAQVGFAVVLDSTADPAAVETRFPLLRDAALSEISALTPTVLRTRDGHDVLRAALTDRAQEIWPDGEVVRVVLTSLLIQ